MGPAQQPSLPPVVYDLPGLWPMSTLRYDQSCHRIQIICFLSFMHMHPLRIHMWSGPRNVSTATMYAFRQRADTEVLDEPLYAHYLSRVDVGHPGIREVLAAQNHNGEQVIQALLRTPRAKPVLFIKHMTHHLVDLSWDFMADGRHFLLIREPRAMLPSLARVLDQPGLADTGLALQVRLFRHLQAVGQDPLVMDARRLLQAPVPVLCQLCTRLGLDFTRDMLSWPAGPKPEDGVWAPYWYAAAHATTGFNPYQPPAGPFPPALLPLLEECQPLYDELARHALAAAPEVSA